jgi:HD superfamily phosphodiesterase
MNEALIAWAERVTRTMIAPTLPRRWTHIQAVAASAREIAPAFGEDGTLFSSCRVVA